jgi:hypothetical protein
MNQLHKAGKEKVFSDLRVWMPQMVLLPSTKAMDHSTPRNRQLSNLKGKSTVLPNTLFCQQSHLEDQTLQSIARSLDMTVMIVNEAVTLLDHYIPLVTLTAEEDMEQREVEASPRMLSRQAEFGK